MTEHTQHELLGMELEQRILLDGAAVDTAADVAVDALAEAPAENTAGSEESTSAAVAGVAPANDRREVIFIDAGVQDAADLVSEIGTTAEVVFLEQGEDGLQQIADYLDGMSDIDAVHVLSHGGEGTLALGSATLTADSIAGEHSDVLSEIGGALSENGDILIYGCDFGADSGVIDALAEATGADVAASDNKTGAADKGGDWELEVQAGEIEADGLVAEGWNGLLEPITAEADAASLDEDTSVIIEVTANDNDPNEDIDLSSVRIVDPANSANLLTELTVAGEGTFRVITDVASGDLGSISFKPEADFDGPVTQISYSVANESGSRATATIDVTINPIEDAPSLDLDADDSTGAAGGPALPGAGTPVAVDEIDADYVDVNDSSDDFVDNGVFFGFSGTSTTDNDLVLQSATVDGLLLTQGAQSDRVVVNRVNGVQGDRELLLFERESNSSLQTLTVRAGGNGDADQLPEFEVFVDGVSLGVRTVSNPVEGGSFDVNNDTLFEDFTFQYQGTSPGTVEIVFLNNGDGTPEQDVNLAIDNIVINGRTFEAEAAGSFTPNNGNPALTGPREFAFVGGTFAFENLPNLSANNFVLAPSFVGTVEEALNSNVINRGADNIFTNTASNNNNVERIDYIFEDGQSAADTSSAGFLILERNGNDDLQIAAITELDADGNAVGFGDPVDLPRSAFGRVGPQIATAVLRDIDPGAGTDFVVGANLGNQTISGAFVSFDALGVASGESIFGYVLVSNDSNISQGSDFAQLDDPNIFPIKGGSGADLLGGGIFVNAQPNPDANVTFVEDGGPVGIADGSLIDSGGENDLVELTIEVGDVPDGNDERLRLVDDNGTEFDIALDTDFSETIVFDGVSIDLVYDATSGTLTATNAAGAGTPMSDAALQGLVDALTYENLSDTPSDAPDRTFTFEVTDQGGQSSGPAVSTLAVVPVNDPPVAEDDAKTTDEDTPVSGSAILGGDGDVADIDPEGDELTVSAVEGVEANVGQQVTLPSGALVTMNEDGTYSYDPNGAFNDLAVGESDTDSFTYTVSDGNGGFDTATVTITITGVNDEPVAKDDTGTTPEDTPLLVSADEGLLANDNDPDGDELAVTEFSIDGVAGVFVAGDTATIPGVGTLTINEDGSYEFVPEENFNGEVPSVSYIVSDGNGGTDEATLQLEVTPVNDPPVAEDDEIVVKQDTAVIGNLLDNDIDPEGDELTVTGAEVDQDGDGVADPLTLGTPTTITDADGNEIGTITVNEDGTFSFDPAPGFNQAVPPVIYEVSDGDGETDQATLQLIMDPAPEAVDDSVATEFGTPTQLNMLANDEIVDGDLESVVIDSVPSANEGSLSYTDANGNTQTVAAGDVLTPDEAATLTFTPATGFSGIVAPIGYTIVDSTGDSSAASIAISVSVESVQPPPNPGPGGELPGNDGETEVDLGNLDRRPELTVTGLVPTPEFDDVDNVILIAVNELDPLGGTPTLQTDPIGFDDAVLPEFEREATDDGTSENDEEETVDIETYPSYSVVLKPDAYIVDGYVSGNVTIMEIKDWTSGVPRGFDRASVTLDDGRALPGWLEDAGAGLFLGEAPAGTQPLVVRIVAEVGDGEVIEATVRFDPITGEIKLLSLENRSAEAALFTREMSNLAMRDAAEVAALSAALG